MLSVKLMDLIKLHSAWVSMKLLDSLTNIKEPNNFLPIPVLIDAKNREDID
jgi:hypothetical protein